MTRVCGISPGSTASAHMLLPGQRPRSVDCRVKPGNDVGGAAPSVVNSPGRQPLFAFSASSSVIPGLAPGIQSTHRQAYGSASGLIRESTP